MPLQMISQFEYLGLGVVDASDSDLSMAFVELAPRFATVAVDYGTLMTKKIHKIIFSFTSTNISNDIFPYGCRSLRIHTFWSGLV